MITLYVVPASHPCVAVMKALELKGLEYERVDFMFGVSNPMQLARFGKRTVPGLVAGDEKVAGSRPIMRLLERLAPSPSLDVDDPAVIEAEEWGDHVLQEHARWIALTAVGLAPESFASFAAGYRIPSLPDWSLRGTKYAVQLEGRLLGHTPSRIRDEYLPSLPADLDRVDALIADGVIGGASPNAADLQILASIRLLLNLGDLEADIAARPCGQRARALFPDYPGHVPPGTFTSPLRAAVASRA